MKEILASNEESNLDVEGFRDLQRRSREFATAKIAEDVGFTKAHELALVIGFQRGWCAKSPDETPAPLKAEQVEWVVNDIAELGVKIGNQFFFLYKGDSLVYEDGKHDDGRPFMWRPVFKREFGECCHPVNYADLRKCGFPHMIGTVDLGDSDEWKPMPNGSAPTTGSDL